MEMHQETKNTAHVSPVIPNVVMQFPDQITQQANDAKELFPIELTNTTGTNILHLNDDCLLEIFSMKSLSLIDLCSLAETGTRFQQITRRVFPKDLQINNSRACDYKFTSRNSSYCTSYDEDGEDSYCTSYDEDGEDNAERILLNFGSILTEIAFESSEEPFCLVLNLVAKYCVDSLNSLKIEGNNKFVDMEISEDVTVKLRPIFKRLQILDLSQVEIVDDKRLFADFDSLIELSIYHGTNCIVLLGNTFPKLERFFFESYVDHDDDQIATFVSRHPRLKTIHLKTLELGSSDVVEIIKHSMNLKEFSVNETLDEKAFSQIVDVVKGRPQVLILKCYFHFNWKNCDENQIVNLLPYEP